MQYVHVPQQVREGEQGQVVIRARVASKARDERDHDEKLLGQRLQFHLTDLNLYILFSDNSFIMQSKPATPKKPKFRFKNKNSTELYGRSPLSVSKQILFQKPATSHSKLRIKSAVPLVRPKSGIIKPLPDPQNLYYFVDRGNNSALVKRVLKPRTQLTETTNQTMYGAHLSIYKR